MWCSQTPGFTAWYNCQGRQSRSANPPDNCWIRGARWKISSEIFTFPSLATLASCISSELALSDWLFGGRGTICWCCPEYARQSGFSSVCSQTTRSLRLPVHFGQGRGWDCCCCCCCCCGARRRWWHSQSQCWWPLGAPGPGSSHWQTVCVSKHPGSSGSSSGWSLTHSSCPPWSCWTCSGWVWRWSVSGPDCDVKISVVQFSSPSLSEKR